MENKNLYCVIMCGGVGSRFWPYSRQSMPKQFLDFNGTGYSLLQQTFYRFSQLIARENILFVANEQYENLIKEQFPDINENQILLEPFRRNTAPCIAWASHHIKSLNPNATIVVTPSDHLIIREKDFLSTIESAFSFAQMSDALVTIGITPTRPETGYGYIKTSGVEKTKIKKVEKFTEKPSFELAKEFIQSPNYLWNTGIFVWTVNSIISAFEKYLPEMSNSFTKLLKDSQIEKNAISNVYEKCNSISIDYGVMERSDQVYVIGGDFGWSDLGTWSAIFDISRKNQENNVTLNNNVRLYNSSNNLVTSTNKEKIIIIEKLDDHIVIDTEDALLICNKDNNIFLKEVVSDIENEFGIKHL